MRSVATHLGAAVAGALIAYALAFPRQVPEQAPPVDGLTAPAPRAAPVADDAETERSACRALAQDNDALREALRRTQGREVADDTAAAPGQRPDSFADVPPEYREDAFSEHIRHVFAELGISGELDIDCSEFPCLAALREHKMTKAEEDAVLAGMRARAYGDEAKAVLRRHSSVGPGGKAYLNIVAFYPQGDAQRVEEGLMARVDEQFAITRAEVSTPPEPTPPE